MGNDNDKKSFWTTLPGILTGIAAMITAIGSILAIILTSSGPESGEPPTYNPPETPEIPVINFFEADPSEIIFRNSSTLRWSVSNAISVTIDHEIKNVLSSGTISVWPTETTIYALTATNEAGSVSKTAAVVVIETLSLPYMADEDGYVVNDSMVGNGPPQAGDYMHNYYVRGFLSFDLTSFPSGAVVRQAMLVLPEPDIIGEPFQNLGNLKFEAVYYGKSLVPAAYDTLTYMVLLDSNGQPSPMIEVSAGIKEAISRGYSRFQIRFSFSLSTDYDWYPELYILPVYEDAPTLEVVYSLP